MREASLILTGAFPVNQFNPVNLSSFLSSLVLHRSTIQLLRFHFSFFLLPVFLFALSQVPVINWTKAVLVFFILHLLVYPSSNGYNSYMDKDETPIGGLSNPLQPTRQLFYTSVVMDVAAILLSLFVSFIFTLGILLYILASRAYSYRGIRLKKYPVIGFLTVFIFQGAWVFFITYHAMHWLQTLQVPLLPCIVSSLLIGALYPLTQIYQHEEDRKDGVTTISLLLGKKGTFVLSMVLFLSATFLLFMRFQQGRHLKYWYLFLIMMFPVVLFFLFWMMKVWKDEKEANFKNSLRMNALATICISTYFITLIALNH
ncbi:MAG: UbiA family prenyltransferase [Flavisolibacter sp.]